jgi:hypothetical protein
VWRVRKIGQSLRINEIVENFKFDCCCFRVIYGVWDTPVVVSLVCIVNLYNSIPLSLVCIVNLYNSITFLISKSCLSDSIKHPLVHRKV